ncbi:hypothetical protein PPERSA_08774 [Pseudocohnilembus persalinus]|uniref:Uncharacterized protein n=1 Tax=Pseudocohnilembus persalinus TaxID=266149 RepID=A0A0V0R8D8_PSEPJ|nr:hypothetical protein PPERSA_08774 [Pseudocohnilembus persalinus]|eukprot:KRX10472.1 hypothetical protein PPERSA_08774 [Pseudocohnilembus persalinus]
MIDPELSFQKCCRKIISDHSHAFIPNQKCNDYKESGEEQKKSVKIAKFLEDFQAFQKEQSQNCSLLQIKGKLLKVKNALDLLFENKTACKQMKVQNQIVKLDLENNSKDWNSFTAALSDFINYNDQGKLDFEDSKQKQKDFQNLKKVFSVLQEDLIEDVKQFQEKNEDLKPTQQEIDQVLQELDEIQEEKDKQSVNQSATKPQQNQNFSGFQQQFQNVQDIDEEDQDIENQLQFQQQQKNLMFQNLGNMGKFPNFPGFQNPYLMGNLGQMPPPMMGNPYMSQFQPLNLQQLQQQQLQQQQQQLKQYNKVEKKSKQSKKNTNNNSNNKSKNMQVKQEQQLIEVENNIQQNKQQNGQNSEKQVKGYQIQDQTQIQKGDKQQVQGISEDEVNNLGFKKITEEQEEKNQGEQNNDNNKEQESLQSLKIQKKKITKSINNNVSVSNSLSNIDLKNTKIEENQEVQEQGSQIKEQKKKNTKTGQEKKKKYSWKDWHFIFLFYVKNNCNLELTLQEYDISRKHFLKQKNRFMKKKMDGTDGAEQQKDIKDGGKKKTQKKNENDEKNTEKNDKNTNENTDNQISNIGQNQNQNNGDIQKNVEKQNLQNQMLNEDTEELSDDEDDMDSSLSNNQNYSSLKQIQVEEGNKNQQEQQLQQKSGYNKQGIKDNINNDDDDDDSLL